MKDKVVALLDFLKASNKYRRLLIRFPIGVIGDTGLRNLTKVDKQINRNSFHCFAVHFNSLCVMVQLMHLYVIKH
jgi:energy-converting hydrogenase Eha subunit H